VLSSIKVMDTVNYILTAAICSCEGGLDAHANTERGNILSSEGETLVGSRVVGNPYLIALRQSCPLSVRNRKQMLVDLPMFWFRDRLEKIRSIPQG